MGKEPNEDRSGGKKHAVREDAFRRSIRVDVVMYIRKSIRRVAGESKGPRRHCNVHRERLGSHAVRTAVPWYKRNSQAHGNGIAAPIVTK